MNSVFAVVIALLFLLARGEASARWLTFEEAKRIYKIDSEDIRVNKDGTFVREYRQAFVVNNEAARRGLDVLEVEYNAAIEKTEVLEAFVINGEQRRRVPKNLISDQADRGNDNGLDKQRTIKIALPNVRVGSVIDYKVRQKKLQPLLKGVYNDVFELGRVATLKGASVKIRSLLHLHFKVHGPQGYVGTRESQSGALYEYEFTLLKDSFFRTTNESEYPNWSQEPVYPLIQVTSLNSWQELSDKINPRIAQMLNAPLPARYAEMMERAGREKSFAQRIDALTAGMSSELRYLGDWRASADHYFPRGLAETAERGFGDCKDFALLLVKMARQLGYRADVALVHRGEREFDPMTLPMPRHFNHMFTRIVDENGKSHWIDPTNILHDATHVNRDIADRPALIISESTRELSQTPAELPESNVIRMEADFEYVGEENLLMNTTVHATGEDARELIRSVSKKSESQRKDFMLRIFSASRPLIKGELSIDDLPKNLLKPFQMKAQVEMQDSPTQAAGRMVIPVSSEFDNDLNFSAENMLLGIKLDDVGMRVSKRKYRNAIAVGDLPDNCSVDSKWMTAERKYSSAEGNISIESITTIKQPFVSNQDLKSAEFDTLRKELRKCLSEKLIIYKKKAS